MRLDVPRSKESEVLLDKDGRDGTGDPDDRGCDTQSSESESNHACSIAMLVRGVDGLCAGHVL